MSTAAVAAHGHDHDHDEEHPPPIVWSAKMPVGLMGMLFFIGSEIALFASFFMAYFFIRVVHEANFSSWAAQMGDAVPLKVATINSVILFSSSVTIHYAAIALKRSARTWQAIWLALTIILGFTFFGLQVREYGNLVHDEHIGPSSSAYSSTFFSITGLHGSHVVVGGILLIILLVRTLRGHYGPRLDQHVGFEAMSVYWHFVDVVWIFVFGLIYLPGKFDELAKVPFAIAILIILLAMFVVPSVLLKPKEGVESGH